ncbi:GATA transcription factor 21 [Citrus sinensis]|uniref:GATA transcription factor 21 n=3 Tax=Citrus TaxID=2706 RepID=A0ACB8NPF2_CITSI|nr:putative GATA transcription factor 22 isoform X2 [Citrus sinensis]ESR64076.1 hypothetical protein CICLE_v10008943mg [Citrus x clementina]KAH9761602.1 GATA transcription factor 21 [Citrus sinensis]KAH9799994.1 GATA transcription factor 21 [Citrus sinensis]KDO80095.1 hypothetical protein CISIN_1g020987mg [Citrus sinensis]
MAPMYLNPAQDHSDPFRLAEAQKRDHQRLQVLHSSSHNRPAASVSRPIFLNSSTQDQGMIKLEGSQQHDQKRIAGGGSSDLQSSMSQPKTMTNKLAIRRREVGEGSTSDNSSYTSSSSGESMSSKMRLANKIINSSSVSTGTHDESVKVAEKLLHEHDNIEVHYFTTNSSNSNNTVRICSDCNTTTTPLWRSGPRGPKSLCNACGIRQRKARKAMQAAAESGTTTAKDNSSFSKIKLQNNMEKKPRTSHVAQYKKVQCNTPDPDPPHHEYRSQRKLCFKDFALSLSSNSALKQVFPRDVEEAAILLMELSCGFSHT